MEAILLGSAAGGGVPQWNCRCTICRLAWTRDPRVRWRTQSSLAVSTDGARWVVINASPDLRQQIADTPELTPHEGLRHSPITSVVLSNGDVDHVAGLLTLRERQPLALYASEAVLGLIEANPIFRVLDQALVTRRAVRLGDPFVPLDGMTVTLFAVPGKVPLWQEGVATAGGTDGSTVGLDISAGGRRIVSIPGCAAVDSAVLARLEGADVLFFDGTLWHDDELMAEGVGVKTGLRMGHISMAGERGSIAALRDVAVARRVFVHINNTNPVLIDGSPEHREAERAGWEIGYDGWRASL
ncbi:pyrroloquinoline quinone biosynthesis protein PqqB [Chelatococcus reniformis]|uniref:pyrroloquinoline quinone biosynthesis protein PqqB n=1 Tax=Chelatococcus reniformis TaxID=1494448 RepID=UPI00166DC0A3|nr:pyrroloquinoline quinone biosynthesis protein PqqB [Chelatococcus reniformis]